MLTVLRHGNRTSVENPVTHVKTEMINVTFVEEGRSGAISSMSGSTDFLNRLTGDDVGLDQVRVHTHPVKAEKIDLFPLGKRIQGHINRKLFSTAQMAQQENVSSRMVDGKPTYFTTYLDDVERPDEDYRMTNETLVQFNPDAFRNVRIRTAQVDVLESLVAQTEQPVPAATNAGTETLGS